MGITVYAINKVLKQHLQMSCKRQIKILNNISSIHHLPKQQQQHAHTHTHTMHAHTHTHTLPLTSSNFHLKSQMATGTAMIWECFTEILYLQSVLLPLCRNSQRKILHMPWQHWYRDVWKILLWSCTNLDHQIQGNSFLQSFKFTHFVSKMLT